MPKLLVRLLLLILPSMPLDSCQVKINYLRKYVYLLSGYKLYPPEQVRPGSDNAAATKGTAFFIRKKGLYLVTAEHVVTGTSSSTGEKYTIYPDTLYLTLFTKVGRNPFAFPVDIRKYKSEYKWVPYWQRPDLKFIKIDIPDQ